MGASDLKRLQHLCDGVVALEAVREDSGIARMVSDGARCTTDLLLLITLITLQNPGTHSAAHGMARGACIRCAKGLEVLGALFACMQLLRAAARPEATSAQCPAATCARR